MLSFCLFIYNGRLLIYTREYFFCPLEYVCILFTLKSLTFIYIFSPPPLIYVCHYNNVNILCMWRYGKKIDIIVTSLLILSLKIWLTFFSSILHNFIVSFHSFITFHKLWMFEISSLPCMELYFKRSTPWPRKKYDLQEIVLPKLDVTLLASGGLSSFYFF